MMQQVLLHENKIGQNQAHFQAFGLDNKSNLLFIELIGFGTVNPVNTNPPDVFRNWNLQISA